MTKVINNVDKCLIDTYCELGAVNIENGDKVVHQALRGLDAYDHFALALYFKQILQANQLMQKGQVTLEEIPRKEKVLFLYELFRHFNFKLTYFEIGTTLFEFIDGLELIDKISGQKNNFKKNIRYRGVEISDVLKQAALRLHPGYDIKHLAEAKEIDKIDVFYDRIVSSYCFKNSQELAGIMNRATVSYANLFLSKTMSYDIINDVGKIQTYFSLPSLVKYLSKPLYYLFGRQNENNIEGFFLNCHENELDEIMGRFQLNIYTAEFMKIKDVRAVNMKEFIGTGQSQIKYLTNQHIKESYDERMKDYQIAIGIKANKNEVKSINVRK